MLGRGVRGLDILPTELVSKVERHGADQLAGLELTATVAPQSDLAEAGQVWPLQKHILEHGQRVLGGLLHGAADVGMHLVDLVPGRRGRAPELDHQR